MQRAGLLGEARRLRVGYECGVEAAFVWYMSREAHSNRCCKPEYAGTKSGCQLSTENVETSEASKHASEGR
jgi:hypothetical protein